MKEWIEYNFGWQDWEKLRRTFLLIFLVPMIVYASAQLYWLVQSRYYSSSTSGRIVQKESIRGINQSRYGNSTSILGFHIRYEYRVNGIRYVKESYNFAGWMKPNDSSIEIWYQPNAPQKSIVIIR